MALVGREGTVADIAAGPGRFTEIFKHANYSFSLDFDPAMLSVISESYQEEVKDRLIVGDASRLPISDGCVDLAFCFRLLHHINDSTIRIAILSELSRISRRWVAVSFYRKESWAYWRKRINGKKIAGYPIGTRFFFREAKSAGLRPGKIRIPLLGNAQTLVLFEKDKVVSR